MKRVISILCTIAMLICLAVPASAQQKLEVYSVEDFSAQLADLNTAPVENEEEMSFSLAATIPSSYDSRTKGCIPAVRDQDESGACWAFASLSALEIDACKQGFASASSVNFSESHLVWFTYSADKTTASLKGEQYVSNTPYAIGGNWSRAAGTLARWSGIANESSFKFYGKESEFSKMSNYAESGRYNTGSGFIIKDAEVFTQINDVKNWIMTHGSCTANINWNTSGYNKTNNSYYSTTSPVNHMITLIGWDDTYSKSKFNGSPSSNGAWLVRDSRGNSLNNGGYFWLSYKSKLTDCAGFSVQKKSNFDNNYTYNAVGFTSATSCTSGSTVANIFKTSSKQNLKAASVVTVTPNTTVEIKVYKGFSGNNVTSGTCLATKKVTFANQGLHQINLDKAVELASGTTFAVAATYSVSSGNVSIPVEQANGKTVNGVKYASAKGQSVGCLNGNKSWNDAVDMGVGNFYVQAFTSDVSKSSVAIKNMSKYNGKTVDYRSTITMYAECVNATNVQWHVEGASYKVNSDSSVTIKEVKTPFKVYCTAKAASGATVTSATETVNVNTSFFAKLLAFFKGWFNALPNLTQ